MISEKRLCTSFLMGVEGFRGLDLLCVADLEFQVE
jgi:hypothetical protein